MKALQDLRHSIYLVLGVVAVAIATAKVVGVENVWEPSRFPGPRREWPKERPFPTPTFGSNDRSRWLTVRALVDHGTFVIGHRDVADDPKTDRGLAFEDGWTSIDKVKNPATHEYYSSKPPLYAVMLAGEYWVLKNAFGLDIVRNRWLVMAVILLMVNVLPFAISLYLLAKLIEAHGTTDFGKLLAFATACFSTYLLTFSNTLNNHTPAACCVVFALYPLLRRKTATMTDDSNVSASNLLRCYMEPGKSPKPWALFLSGFFAALTATFDLPAASFAAFIVLYSLLAYRIHAVWVVFGAMLPVAAFFAANHAALGQWMPAYSEFGGPWYDYPGSHWLRLQQAKTGAFVPGIDFAQESRAVYLFHCLFGHHGWFSLTPVWLVGILGIVATVKAAGDNVTLGRFSYSIAVQLAGVLTLVLVVFFVFIQKTNNYGGGTSGLRWFFWLSPLWVLAVLAGADRLAEKKWARIATCLLLGFSVLSVFYPAWNPWRSPWIQVALEQTDVLNYEKSP